MGKYTASVIARTAFATDINVYKDEENQLLKNMKELFSIFTTKWNPLIFFLCKNVSFSIVPLSVFCPNIARWIERWTDFVFFGPKQLHFFKQVLSDLFDQRINDPEAKTVRFLFCFLRISSEIEAPTEHQISLLLSDRN